MLRISLFSLSTMLLTTVGCTSDDDKDTGAEAVPAADAGSDSDAEWSDLDEDDSSDKEDDWDGGDDGGDDSGKSDFAECGDEVVAGAACEGGWEDTLCLDDVGQMWWCEGGVWTSEKEE